RRRVKGTGPRLPAWDLVDRLTGRDHEPLFSMAAVKTRASFDHRFTVDTPKSMPLAVLSRLSPLAANNSLSLQSSALRILFTALWRFFLAGAFSGLAEGISG